MSLDNQYASIRDLHRKAKCRVPKFAFDYLEGGIGSDECCRARNRSSLDAVKLLPRNLNGVFEADMKTTLFGRTYDAPFGVAPVGLTGLIWPGSAEMIATAARRRNVPFALSTVSTLSIEKAAKLAGDCYWFQLYAPHDTDIMNALIKRAEDVGSEVMIVSIDVPAQARRERDMRNGLSMPPKLAPKTLLDIAFHPTWALTTLFAGPPKFVNLEPHFPPNINMQQVAKALAALLHGPTPAERLERIRERWQGKLVVKGVLSPEDAELCKSIGADGIVVSNHGGRQCDAAPAPLEVLPKIRSVVGPEMPLIVDSGIESGLDIARVLAAGADFALLGRAFLYGAAALGQKGADHAMHLLYEELRTLLIQNGCQSPKDLPGRLYTSEV